MFHHRKSYSLEQANSSIQSSSFIPYDQKKNNEVSISNIVCKTIPPAKHNPFLGFFYAFLTSIFITLTSVFVKKLSYISPGHLSLVRNAGVFAGCLPIAIYSVKDVIGPKKDRLMLLVRGFLGATALYLNLTAYRYLPLSEAAVVMSTAPALVTVAAYFYLKESCGRIQILCLVITFCGVLLSVRLPELLSKGSSTNHFDSAYLGGLASAVGCVIIISFTVVTLRKMKYLHFSVPLLYFGFLGMIENFVINFTTSSFVFPKCGWDEIFIMLIGILGFMGHCTMTLGVQAEAVGILTVMKASIDIVIAMICQIIFFNADIGVYNITGACIVIVSVSIMGFSKYLNMLPEESRTRKKFKYFI